MMPRSRHAHGGFTFVEVLAALTFLAILVPVVVEALTISNRAGVVSERTSIAVQLAENQLNELVVTNGWSTGNNSGNFGDDYAGYRWELTRADWDGGNGMSELTMTVTFQVQGQDRRVQLSTLASQTQTQP